MAMTLEGFTLEKFARHPFYMEVNRRLVTLAELRRGFKVVDLGAGTGAVTRLLAEAVCNKQGAEVIAVEPSESALEVAKRNLENIRELSCALCRAERRSCPQSLSGRWMLFSSATPFTLYRKRRR